MSTLDEKLNSQNVTTNSSSKKENSVGSQLSALKTKLSKAERETSLLREKISQHESNKGLIILDDVGFKSETSLRVNGKHFVSTVDITVGEGFKSLIPLLRPLANFANSVIRGHDIEMRKARMKLNDGKLTKERAVDKNGKALNMPSISDKLRDEYIEILRDAEINEHLALIAKRIDTIKNKPKA